MLFFCSSGSCFILRCCELISKTNHFHSCNPLWLYIVFLRSVISTGCFTLFWNLEDAIILSAGKKGFGRLEAREGRKLKKFVSSLDYCLVDVCHYFLIIHRYMSSSLDHWQTYHLDNLADTCHCLLLLRDLCCQPVVLAVTCEVGQSFFY